METLLQDLRYALRMLAKSPGFTGVAVLTLALGIGANSALFSVVNGVLLNPLPYPNPDELYSLYSRTAMFQESSVSYPNYLDWRSDNRSFSGLGAYRDDDFNLTGAGQPERLHAHMISSEFFSILGVKPILGRAFTSDEDRAESAPVAILSDGLWKRRFGASADVIGKTMNLHGSVYTIVGVFTGRAPFLTPTDIYVPVGQWNDPTFRNRRISMGMNVVGRVKPGVAFAQARADMDSVAQHLAETYPDADKGTGISIVPLKKDVVGDVQGILFILLGAVGFVLLIACANVANLLLARSTGRTREFAIRAALGASQIRVVRQLLTESVLLSLAGGAMGLAIAKWGTQAVIAALPQALPRSDEISLDARVLLFTLGVSVLTGILFGLVPAIKTFRADLHDTLKEGGRGGSGRRHRTQSVFVAVEMGMALVLLIGAGLMIRSLAALWNINPGFDARNVLTFSLSLSSKKTASAAELRQFYRESLRQYESAPGVESVSPQGGSLPMSGDSELPFWLEGQPKPASDSEMPFALFYLVTPGYFSAMRIPLLRGRFLNQQDDEHSPAVMVIDESFARKFFPNQDPIGKRINVGLIETQPEIVGVVGHVEHWGLGSTEHQNLQAEFYLPFFQIPDKFWPLVANGLSYVIRTASAPLGAAAGVRSATQKLDSTGVIYEVHAMEEIVQNSVAMKRFSMLLLVVFAALALVLSAVGIYGVISYIVGQRAQEIGIRMALGAQQRDVLRLVLEQGGKMALVGVAGGLVAAVGLTRLMAQMLYGVSARDPLTFAGVALALTFVALAACYIPARRAARVDPLVALRYE